MRVTPNCLLISGGILDGTQIDLPVSQQVLEPGSLALSFSPLLFLEGCIIECS